MLATLAIDCLALAVILISSPLRGPGRLLGPSALCGFMLFGIFAIRPLAAHADDFNFYGLDASSGAGYAEKVGTIALVSMAFGAVLAGSKGGVVRPLRAKLPGPSLVARSPWVVVGLAVLGGLVTAVILVLLGGTSAVHGFFVAGRSAQLSRVLAGLPTFVSMISFLGSAASAVYAATVVPRRKFSRLEVFVLSLAIGMSFLLNVSTGNRRALIPILLVPASVVLLGRGGRVSGKVLLVAGLGVVFFATLPFVRSEGARPGTNVFVASTQFATANGFSTVAHDFFVSYDTEMLQLRRICRPSARDVGAVWGRSSGLRRVGDVPVSGQARAQRKLRMSCSNDSSATHARKEYAPSLRRQVFCCLTSDSLASSSG